MAKAPAKSRKRNEPKNIGVGRKRQMPTKPKGLPNRISRTLAELARAHTDDCIETLVQIMRGTLSKRVWVDDPKGGPNGDGKQADGKRAKRQVRQQYDITVADRRAAAEILLDRGYGKPKQAFDHTVAPPDLSALSDEELDAYYKLSCKLHSVDPTGPLPGQHPDGDPAKTKPPGATAH